jgi:hypothetical protein
MYRTLKETRGRWIRLAAFAFSASGYLVTTGILAWGFGTGHFTAPGGDTLLWDRVGDNLRAGLDVYARAPVLTNTFFYAPPWAVIFASVSWLPVELWYFGIVTLEIVAVRYLAGSWIRVGWFCWWPFVAFELPSGNFNLIMAASILAAIRGEPRPAVVMALAKLAPALSLRPRDWRNVLYALVICAVITVPWLRLWPHWVEHMISALSWPTLGPQVPIMLPVRLLAAGGLLVLRKPWATALAAVVATPAFYYGSLVLLLAPIAVLLDPRVIPGSERDEPAREAS